MALELTGDKVLRLSMRIMGRSWVWGEADCCTAACDVFQALHGVDPMASLRGVYRTKIGAQRAIVARGGWMAMAEALHADLRLYTHAKLNGTAIARCEAYSLRLQSCGSRLTSRRRTTRASSKSAGSII